MNIKTALQWGKANLTPSSDTAHLDAMILLSHVVRMPHTKLITQPDDDLSATEQTAFERLIQRRQRNEPIPYLIGTCEFWSLPFKVTPDCLIPRPETEVLVEQLLNHYPKSQPIRLADLGTGSGAIAIALASERPAWHITATDQSEQALHIAQSNAQALGIQSIDFKLGSWLDPLSQHPLFDGIISNPPYLNEEDPHLLHSLRYEPHSALVSKEAGYADLHHLITHSRDYLQTGGRLWLEHGYNQANTIKTDLFEQGYTDIRQYKDLASIVRVSCGRYVAKQR